MISQLSLSWFLDAVAVISAFYFVIRYIHNLEYRINSLESFLENNLNYCCKKKGK